MGDGNPSAANIRPLQAEGETAVTSQSAPDYSKPPKNMPTRGSKLYFWFLIALLSGYWLLSLLVERSNMSAQLLAPWNFLLPLEDPSRLTIFITGMFSFKVMRHLIPVIVGAYFAYEAAVHLVWQLYDFPDKKDARKFLGRLRSSGPSLEQPLLISADTLEDHRQDSVILHVGGPGRIQIKGTEVAVTEINDSLCRILPGGKHWLYPFEYVHTVIDLRPQERTATDVSVRTSDGIPLIVTFNIRYRVKQGQQPTRQNPYPYDAKAVRFLAYKITVSDDAGSAGNWEKMPLGLTTKMLTITLKKYLADEILHPDGREDEPYLALTREVVQTAKAALDKNGIELLDINIHSIKLPNDIEEPYMKYWQMQSNLQIQMSQADNEATALEEEEKARAEAEAVMIEAILEGIRRARRSGATTNIGEVVALRLVEALEQMAYTSQHRRPEVYRPLLPQITQIHQELTDNNDESSGSKG
ncbi:MAG TPA: SPFH domain-containing protein [Anaerolineae bacterium]|nr:SPFH domain-containing protein [Anaerolineae bacterium]